jgi:hypothetical protein
MVLPLPLHDSNRFQCSMLIHVYKIHHPYSPCFTLFLLLYLPVNMTCFTFFPSLFKFYSLCMWLCLGIFPIDTLYFSQSDPSIIPLYPFLTTFRSFQCVSLYLVPIQMQCISILFTITLFFPSSPSLL